MNRITQLANDSLRKRWSTVIILALILTAGKTYASWSVGITDWQSFAAEAFFTFVISFIASLLLHIVLYVIFSPRKKEEAPVVVTPSLSKEEHESNIKALNKELEAVQKADVAAQIQAGTAPMPEKIVKPIDLHKELGVRKTKKRKAAKKVVKRAPKKKAAKKKK